MSRYICKKILLQKLVCEHRWEKVFTLVISFLAPSPELFPVLFAPMGFLTELVTTVWGAFGETGASEVPCFAIEVSFRVSLILKSISPLAAAGADCEATGDDGKPTSSAILLATSLESNCLYNSAALDVYLASILPPSVHPCCLKKTCARLFPPKLIIFSCSAFHESKFVDLKQINFWHNKW